jgi:hypothetical protein
MSTYRYQGPPEQRAFGPLPPGDYDFVVSDITEPHESSSGNQVLSVKLSIQPGGETVFANPWCGQDRDGNERDDIALFLLAINRIPKIGEEPRWQQLVGARGRVRLKTEVAQQGNLAGKEISRVAFFHAPKTVGPTAQQAPQTYSEPEARKAAKAAQAAAGSSDIEPDDIPF